jgi:hypothetical protein
MSFGIRASSFAILGQRGGGDGVIIPHQSAQFFSGQDSIATSNCLFRLAHALYRPERQRELTFAGLIEWRVGFCS